MAQPWVTGPVSIWVASNINAINTPIFLGHGEEAPEIDHRPQFEPVMCDLTGTRIPMDVADEGEDAIIAVNLVRWNEDVLVALQTRPGLQAAQFRGSRLAGDLGTLYLTENAAFSLWVFFPYVQKTAYATGTPGYRYFGAYFMGPDSLRKNGTRARIVQCIFHALPVLVGNPLIAGGSNLGVGGTLLYNNDMSLLAGKAIN